VGFASQDCACLTCLIGWMRCSTCLFILAEDAWWRGCFGSVLGAGLLTGWLIAWRLWLGFRFRLVCWLVVRMFLFIIGLVV